MATMPTERLVLADIGNRIEKLNSNAAVKAHSTVPAVLKPVAPEQHQQTHTVKAPTSSHSHSSAGRHIPGYLAASEYVNDILEVLRQNEQTYAVKDDYIRDVQTDINERMRSILVDWLVEVAEEYRLHQETLHLAVNYLDRFLEVQPVSRSQLQLVGASCLLLAAKFEEMYPPVINEIVYISDYTYTRSEVIRMESMVLDSLHFRLTSATQMPFLSRMLGNATASDDITSSIAFFLADLTLQDYSFVHFLPSMTAASCVYVSRRASGQQAWTPTLKRLSGLDAPDFACVAVKLLKLWRRSFCASTSLTAVRDKYKSSRYYGVGELLPPESL